ncbi:MAG: S9 family peptidase [Candidatus Bipolaricaulota bacterium]|nr:S9 family peptidase [Candidatus Bipolaricaulota bacterium]MCS7274637.1 S9 family peptidase [Candidatus Bipolaricaulota bacterium]MDW8110933.1 S9 family peptidase [Candidatus Bipolaricaulota bacterium]
MPKIAPYGSWKSPIAADVIARGAVRLMQVVLDGEDIYWLESRPAEGGRYVIVKRSPDGTVRDVTPAPFYARTTVHEYGGGDFLVHNGTVYFSNFKDQRLYAQTPSTAPQPITPDRAFRYADAVIDTHRNRLICVREDHTIAGREAVNTIVGVNLDGDPDGGRVLVSGNDFYASPRISPEGTRLAWLAWNHPNMPWDGTELWVAEIAHDGSLKNFQKIAGGPTESIFQPEWAPDSTLYFVSDRTGWWNLYRWRGRRVEALTDREAEFGQPQWVFGMSTYGFVSERELVCAYTQNGTWRLARLDTVTKTLQEMETPYTEISYVRASANSVVFRGGSPTEMLSIVRLDLRTRRYEVLRRSSDLSFDEGYLSFAQPIEFHTEGGQTAYAFFYPPKNRDFQAPPGEKPPLLVLSHGGPTSATTSTLKLEIQFWTSRGFAVVDVNYGGSTGYGRAYRERLKGQWGIVDVDDCVNAAKYLVQQGLVDGERVAIRGGSAGGYTTLCALTFRKFFTAGASYFGVSDLEALDRDTHKFESRYNRSLIGPYPERRDLYYQRSPIHFAHQISCPVIFFQGLEDRVVPPSQSEMMVEALRKKGVPVAYIAFEGEQHGFRKAETIQRSLEAELYFYSKVFGFEVADPVQPFSIDNL